MKMSAKELKEIKEDLKNLATLTQGRMPLDVVRPTQEEIDKYKFVAKGMRGLKTVRFIVQPDIGDYPT